MRTIQNHKVRCLIRWVVPFALIPLLVLLGGLLFREKGHLLVSFGVVVLALFLFLAGFESKTTGSRRLVLVAAMTALCIVGRFIPFFKPVTAVTVITAVYLGSESGFLVGALAAVLSNFYFGQGPWTPFQMLAWGLIGLFAGMLANSLKRHKSLLLLYGVFAGVLFSFLMDFWTVLWYNGGIQWSLYASAIAVAVPHTVLYSVSNFIFLWFMAKPFGDKLERIKLKYGV